MYKKLFLFLIPWILLACSQGINPGYKQQISSRPLSLTNQNFRTCVFDPGYSIVHFPMYHSPPKADNISTEVFETVVKSQFQLLHTLIDYNRSYQALAVFDEHITDDTYNENYVSNSSDSFTKLDGSKFFVTERKNLALKLFQSGFPAFYEHLNQLQKDYLWTMGASLTLYFLKEIRRLYKVIEKQSFDLVLAKLGNNFTDINNLNSYWIYQYREQELKLQIQNFYKSRPAWKGLAFIAYGKKHDFSDDFQGYPFQSGHSFCLNWSNNGLEI
ncbi:MAG: hypothetical protein GDA46_02410 [Bdellovibrionales bacterium]|nr:hypothetical protein [Bdellovibrionales bacterium]